KALIESGLADDSVLTDTQAAVESGHYYRSFAVDLENAHKFISSKYPAFKERFADFRAWSEYGTADGRRQVIQRALEAVKSGRAVDEIAARAAFKNLEEHRLLVLAERIKTEVVKGDQEFKKKVAEILGRNAKAFRLN